MENSAGNTGIGMMTNQIIVDRVSPAKWERGTIENCFKS